MTGTPSATDTASNVEVTRNDDAGRYEVTVDGELAGFAEFRDHPSGVREMPHTVVETPYKGRGLAGIIVRYALDEIRADGLRVRPTCSYVNNYLTTHPDYADLREGA